MSDITLSPEPRLETGSIYLLCMKPFAILHSMGGIKRKLTKEEAHAHYLKYRDYYKKSNAKHYLENKERIQAKHEIYRRTAREKVINHLGGKCLWCGYDDFKALQIDHVNGDGYKTRKVRRIFSFYKEVIADRTGSYQLLCANCNQVKKADAGEHAWRNR